VFFCSGIAYWVYDAVAAYFALGFPLDLFVTFLSYSFFVGSYTGLAASCSGVLLHDRRPALRWVGIPALWVSAEFARTSLFSGFSWELLGYTQYRQLSLIQVADMTGVYGLSFLLALSSYVFAECWTSLSFFQPSPIPYPTRLRRLPWPAVGSLLGVVVLALCYGTWRLHQYESPAGPSLKLALVEGNIPHAQRWQRVYYATTLLKYIAVTRQGVTGIPLDLVVWPEFALGFYLDREPALQAQLGQFTRSLDTSLLLGAPRLEETAMGSRYYNSAYLLAPGGALQGSYDKMRLLPFAEYCPLPLLPFCPQTSELPSAFTPGRKPTIFLLPRAAFGVTICYEATYPDLSRHLAQAGAQFLVNISNDTWLAQDNGAAAAQHFSMTVFRAVENKRPLVRATTAGVSGFIDPTGSSHHLSTKPDGVIVGEVIPRREVTMYARYGDWFACGCIGIALLALLDNRLWKRRPFLSYLAQGGRFTKDLGVRR